MRETAIDSFVSEQDYVVIGSEALKVIQQSDETKRHLAEQAAREEIASYLRGRYDTRRIFAARGAERNTQLVVYYCDIALYHLVSWLPARMGHEVRKERYERAIAYLEQVQQGRVTPDLPRPDLSDAEQEDSPIRFSPGVRNTYDW